MSTALLLIKQVLVMFLLSAVGFVMFRKGKITLEGNKSIGNILIYLSLPCVIINGFQVERTAENIKALGLSVGLAALALAICILVARLLIRKNPVGTFAATFSNPGFFGVPLITNILGQDSVFYIAAFIAFLNLLQWSYGVSLFTAEKKKISVKSIVTAPFMIAILIGMFLFFTQIRLPDIVSRSLNYMAALNTPLAMFTIGVYAAQMDMLAMFKKKELYLISLIRQVVIPLLVLLVFSLFGNIRDDMYLAILIAAACPVGSNVAVYAQLHDANYSYAVETVVISTLTSVVTLPLLMRLIEIIG